MDSTEEKKLKFLEYLHEREKDFISSGAKGFNGHSVAGEIESIRFRFIEELFPESGLHKDSDSG